MSPETIENLAQATQTWEDFSTHGIGACITIAYTIQNYAEQEWPDADKESLDTISVYLLAEVSVNAGRAIFEAGEDPQEATRKLLQLYEEVLQAKGVNVDTQEKKHDA